MNRQTVLVLLVLSVAGLLKEVHSVPFLGFPGKPYKRPDVSIKLGRIERDEFNLSMDYWAETCKEERLAKYKHPITNFCKGLYSKNNMSKVKPQKDLLIPKIVHLAWLGPKTPPAVLKDCLEGIERYLPHWEVRFWTDSDIPSLNLINQKYYDEESNYGAKSDILRYELLYKFGGVWFDVDMVVVKPLDILHYTYEFYAGLHPANTVDVMGSAIVASVSGHPILKHCIESFKDHRHLQNQLERTGPIHFEKSFFEVCSKHGFDRVVAFPASFFYPLDPKFRLANTLNESLKLESFAVHGWANSW